MNFLESIDFVNYVPMIGPRGLFSRKEPLLVEGQRVKSMDLIDIIALLDSEVTGKFVTYIAKDKIRVDEDKEKLMTFLPKTEIKMIEVYNETNFFQFKKNKYVESTAEAKSYIFYMFDEYKPYAAILFLIATDRLMSFSDAIADKLDPVIIMIIEGICYGYPKEYIKGFNITKSHPLNLFRCIQGMNVTKKEKDLLFGELKEFEESELYTKLTNKFEEDYALAEDIIDAIITNSKFKAVLKDMTSLEQPCTPDYVLSPV